jgi:hypothetical protein
MDATGDVVIVVEPVMPEDVAVITAEPREVVVAVTRPREAEALLTTAIFASDEVQVTEDVRFLWVLFENVPVAVNRTLVPGAMLELAGVTERETRVTGTGSSIFDGRPHAATNTVRNKAPEILIHD